MSLVDTVRGLVAVADRIAKPFQAPVMHARWIASGGSGDGTYAAAVPVPALVDWKQEQVRTPDGILTVSRAVLTFPYPIDVNDEDIFTLPDGSTGPILDMSGFVDAGNPIVGRPFVTGVMIG
jgi:hypothetical protein